MQFSSISRAKLVILIIAGSIASISLAQSPSVNIPAPSSEQLTKLCANTADIGDCGKKVEAIQIKRASAFVKRSGKLLAVKLPNDPPYLFEDLPGEAGPNISFYAYNASTESVVLYRAKEDRLDFLLLHLPTGTTSILPNEPLFTSDGLYFATVDFCQEACENRLSVWRYERKGPVRERYFTPQTPWTDAGVTWGAPRRLIIDYTEASKNLSMNLELNDRRWTVLLP